MQAQITYRGLPTSSALNDLVQRKVAKLTTFSDRITDCQVVIEAPHRHQNKGWLYRVRVRLHVAGRELVADGEKVQNTMHDDAYVAVRVAFQAAFRQLKAMERRKPQARTRLQPALVADFA
jgi:ribosomal subunit interface protein